MGNTGNPCKVGQDMILTVDIGNTHIKVGAWDEDRLAFVSRLQTNTLRTQDEYAIDLMSILQLNECNQNQFDGAIISCVVPPLSIPFREAVQQTIFSKRVYLVSPGLKTGLNIKLDDPGTLGADMVCASVAAIAKYSLPCIIIGLGTATTMFALDAEGCFLGGLLLAGVGIQLEALSQRTAQLPHISLDAPRGVIGTNTVDCMKAGAVYGTASMLDGLIARMQAQLGEETVAVACGGFAEAIVGYCQQQVIVDENLVLEGLRLLYHKNAK